MAQTLGILFLHHDQSPVTLNNLRSVRLNNPDAKVVTMSAGKPMRGGYCLDDTALPKKLHSLNASRSSDWLVCSWFMQRREKCTKWWIIEWDVFCAVSAREYYGPVWRFPFVASSVKLSYREPGWRWFARANELPEAYKPFAMGAVPFLYLVTDKALTAICEILLAEPATAGNGELRFATAANRCGFPPCGYSPPHDRITWMNLRPPLRPGTISHPVKFRAPLGLSKYGVSSPS